MAFSLRYFLLTSRTLVFVRLTIYVSASSYVEGIKRGRSRLTGLESLRSVQASLAIRNQRSPAEYMKAFSILG